MDHRGRLRLLALLGVCLAVEAAWAGPTTYTGLVVQEVRFDAPPSVDVDELRYLVELSEGDVYRPGDVGRSIELLYGLGLFQEVYVSVILDGATLSVTFHLLPSPTVKSVEIHGLPATFRTSRARDALTLRRGDVFFPGDELDMVQALRSYLASEGYPDATVEIDVVPLRNQQVDIDLQVDPGEMLRIVAVEFNPGAQLPEDLLRRTVTAAAFEGNRYRSSTVQKGRENLQRLYTRREYLEARVLPPIIELRKDGGGAVVIYNIVPSNPVEVVFRVSEQGIRRRERVLLSGGTQARALRQVIGLEQEPRLSSGFVRDATFRIADHYRQNGYAEVQVRGDDKEVGSSKRLEFVIETGPRSVLVQPRDISVDGNKVLRDRDVRSMVRDRMMRPQGKPSVTDRAMANALLDIEDRYAQMGHLEARVTLRDVRRQQRSGGLPQRTLIALDIDEGVQTTVRDVEILGNLRIPTDDLAALAEPLRGRPLDRAGIETALDELAALYGASGYVDVRVTSSEDLSEDRTEATLIWTIEEGDQVRFGKVVVRGNRHTRTRLIRTELSMEPGRLWNVDEVERSRRRMMDTGLFSQVTMRPLNTSGRVRDVLVEVAERRRWRLMIGGGISSADGLRMVGENRLSNIAGVGHTWSTYVHFGTDWENLQLLFSPSIDAPIETEWKIVTGYEVAYIPRVPLRTNIRLLLNERTLQPTYIVQRYGVGLGAVWSQELPRDYSFLVMVNASVLWRYPDNVDPAAVLCDADRPDPAFDPGFLGLIGAGNPPESLRRLGLFSLSGQLDLRDDPFNPTLGLYLTADLEGTDAGPLSQEQFGRFRNRITWYLPLYSIGAGRVIGLSSGVEWGASWVYGDTEMLPIEYRYRLGGATSVRGYALETLGPTVERDTSLATEGFTDSTTRIPVGGDVFFAFNLEIKVPVPRVRALDMVVFFDGGNAYLFRGDDDDKLDRALDPRIRTAAGVGVRFKTPVGPLRLDYGIQLGRLSPMLFPARNDEAWYEGSAFHFSVGAL
jgi:outer membrane protein insertion porin family